MKPLLVLLLLLPSCSAQGPEPTECAGYVLHFTANVQTPAEQEQVAGCEQTDLLTYCCPLEPSR